MKRAFAKGGNWPSRAHQKSDLLALQDATPERLLSGDEVGRGAPAPGQDLSSTNDSYRAIDPSLHHSRSDSSNRSDFTARQCPTEFCCTPLVSA
jgi:hypothetical protein